jgi:hypothetical protein
VSEVFVGIVVLLYSLGNVDDEYVVICTVEKRRWFVKMEMLRNEMRGKLIIFDSLRLVRPIYLILDDSNPEILRHVPNFLRSLIHLHHTSTSLVTRYGKRNRF